MVKKVLIYDDKLLVQSIGRGLKHDLGVESEGVQVYSQALESLATNEYSAFIIEPLEIDYIPREIPFQFRDAYPLIVRAYEQRIPTVVLTTSLTRGESDIFTPLVIGQMLKPCNGFELSLLLYNHGVSNFSSPEEESRMVEMLRYLQLRDLRGSYWF